MNRDLKKIIVIDWDENAYQLQPRNALHRLKKWDGDENDTDLVYLASFLKCSRYIR
jgi:import inner membrane translocase subunit TIM50